MWFASLPSLPFSRLPAAVASALARFAPLRLLLEADDEESGVLQKHQKELLFWGFVLLAMLVGLMYLVKVVRRKVSEPDDGSNAGFTLSDLRQLHREGQLTDEEFEKAKARIVGAHRAAMEREARAKGKPAGPANLAGIDPLAGDSLTPPPGGAPPGMDGGQANPSRRPPDRPGGAAG